MMSINHLRVETEDAFASLLEFAANNNAEGIKRWIERDPFSIDEVGLWYGRQNASNQMVLERRTPLMVAASYGSIDVLELILSFPQVDVNRLCGRDKTTPLHCAASGGSVNSLDTVKLLLEAGADPNLVDANGNRPRDVIAVSQNLQNVSSCLEHLLEIGIDSPKIERYNDPPASSMLERKEYLVDPYLPDIKNGVYSTDEFRMFSFKIRPCSRAYSHDWTECPFLHPGENARRRDPRKYHYSCVPCPDFRNKGACRRGDMCEYGHGVFECWLHPAQYRTRICKDGINCNRRVCFFAHTQEELRPLYESASAVLSPSANAMDWGLIPGSPSSVSVMSPTPFTPPMSPSNNGISNMGWPQQNPHSSRVRLSRSSISTNSFNSLLQTSFRVSSPGRMSPRITDPTSPMASQFRSLSFNNSSVVVGSPVWSKWGCSAGKPNCDVNDSEPFEGANNGEEPDLSWVQCLVKESPQDMKETPANIMTIAGTNASHIGY